MGNEVVAVTVSAVPVGHCQVWNDCIAEGAFIVVVEGAFIDVIAALVEVAGFDTICCG